MAHAYQLLDATKARMANPELAEAMASIIAGMFSAMRNERVTAQDIAEARYASNMVTTHCIDCGRPLRVTKWAAEYPISCSHCTP